MDDMTHATQSKTRVAVIGSGLAGLVTTHLLRHDRERRFDVTLFEQADTLALDAASVTIENTATGVRERLNVPSRGLTRGYYPSLTRMYDHLGIPLRRARFTFIFGETTTRTAAVDEKVNKADGREEERETDVMAGAYFVFDTLLSTTLRVVALPFTRRRRRRPDDRRWAEQLWQTLFLAACHVWLMLACFLVRPRTDYSPSKTTTTTTTATTAKTTTNDTESLRSYLQRIRLPRRYVRRHLLPALCAVCTCTHAQLLAFPASDVVDFMRRSALETTYVTDGVHELQSKLVRAPVGEEKDDKGERVVLRTRVTRIRVVEGGIRLSWQGRRGDDDDTEASAVFDRVVLAVDPNAAAALFEPAGRALGGMPTARVVATVIDPFSSSSSSSSSCKKTAVISVSERGEAPSERVFSGHDRPQLMCFRTAATDPPSTSRGEDVETEAWHFLPTGAICRTAVSSSAPSSGRVGGGTVVHEAGFTRTLRTVESRRTVQRVVVGTGGGADKGGGEWVNGRDNVWVAGSWCWDGMVLLEGCVVSAERIARAFGVDVPWADAGTASR